MGGTLGCSFAKGKGNLSGHFCHTFAETGIKEMPKFAKD
jgi:hypothetical protein